MKNIAFIGLFFLVFACSSREETNLAPQEFKVTYAATPGAVLLDVRTPEEVAEGIIPGASVLDFTATDFDQQISSLDKSKTYFVYCASGGRSGKTVDLMKTKGFENVYGLDGGMGAWKEEGLEVSKP